MQKQRNQTFENEKKLVEIKCQQYKIHQDYIRLDNQRKELNKQIEQTTLNINSTKYSFEEASKNLDSLKQTKEQIQKEIQEIESKQEEINKKLQEIKEQKISNSKENQNQFQYLQDQKKILQTNQQNKKKCNQVYYLFDESDMSFLENNFEKSAKNKENILKYNSQKKSFLVIATFSFSQILQTFTEQIKNIQLKQTQNNAEILIKIVVNSVKIQDYSKYQIHFNNLISQIMNLKKSGYELKIHIFDKNCGDQLCFYELYTRLDTFASMIYQNIGITTFNTPTEYDFNNSDQNYDVEKNKLFKLTLLEWQQTQLSNRFQIQQKQLDSQISSLQVQLQEKQQFQEQLIQKLKSNQEEINTIEKKTFKLKMQLDGIQTTLTSIQKDLSVKTQSLETLEQVLKTQEHKNYLSLLQNQLNMANQECEDLKNKISTLETSQQKSEALFEKSQNEIIKIDKLYNFLREEIFTLFPFIYLFSGENDLLLLMFAQSFNSQTQFIDANLEKNLQKVFGLDQRNSQIFLSYIQVKVERKQQNQIDIQLIPEPKDEIKLEKLNKIINEVHNQINQNTIEVISKLEVLNTQELMTKALNKFIVRTN
ncbi:hypothetical protein ABPG73_020614 [Tetrahymena malaccensis]